MAKVGAREDGVLGRAWHKEWICLLMLLSTLTIGGQADLAAADPARDREILPDKPLVVAIQHDGTYTRKDKDGHWTGPMVDFWTLVAAELKRPYVFKEMSLSSVILALQNGTVDVAATTMFVTAERERLFDLSTPLGEARPALLTTYKVKHEHPWIEAVEVFLTWRTVKVIFVLLAVVFCLGIAIWLIERKENRDDFSNGFLGGAAAGVYWAGSTLASGLCLGINLKTVRGRFFGLVWMMVCALALSAFIASLTHSLSDQLQETQALDDTDLRYMYVGVKKGAVQAEMIREIGGYHALFDTDEEALKAILSNQIDGYLCPDARAYHFANEAYNGRVSVYETSLKGHLYSLSMPKGSPLRRPINVAILKLMANSTWESLMERYGLEKISKRKRSG
jgi:polar amino acid transport system substrate-binding protein